MIVLYIMAGVDYNYIIRKGSFMEEKKQQGGAERLHAGHRSRLRGTYTEHGADAMQDHQLLELLLTYSIPRRDTNPLAHRLLSSEGFGSLDGVFGADISELMKVEGVGEATAVLLSLVGSMGRRTASEKVRNMRLNSPAAAMEYCKSLAFSGNNESMYVISLDRAQRVIYADKVSTGTPGEVTMYPRTAVEIAIRRGAENVMLCHNHPSGNLTPSKNDLDTTNLVIKALASIGITLNDHIIVGGGRAYSMSQQMHRLNEQADRGLATAAEKEE